MNILSLEKYLKELKDNGFIVRITEFVDDCSGFQTAPIELMVRKEKAFAVAMMTYEEYNDDQTYTCYLNELVKIVDDEIERRKL